MNEIDILEQAAVDAAINLCWDDAIKLNLKILKIDKNNLTAYLRLGFAYIQTKKLKESIKSYRKALKIQPKSTVALENLERLNVLSEKDLDGEEVGLGKNALDPYLFLEVHGKTKTAALVNHGQKDVLAKLFVGQGVTLKIKKRRVEVRTTNGKYIGSLPDDLSKRLIFFIKSKSKYSTYIKEASLNHTVVFIKEELKGKSVRSHISFPLNTTQKIPEIVNSDEEKSESNEEEVEEENQGWEKLAAELTQDEKETVTGIQTEDLDEEE